MTTPAPDPCCAAQVERDQYQAAARHLAFRIRHTAYVWATTLPEMIRTAEVVEALNGIACHVPDRPELRDDLWMRIAGAYEARFENDGHPEDARAAADEAMSVIQPELAAGQQAQETLKALAPMFQGLDRLLTTSSRDWGEYRVDVWLWAVICGWDCEQAEHTASCVHGVMEEMAQRHGWSPEAVAKARRYRAAVRAVQESAEDAG